MSLKLLQNLTIWAHSRASPQPIKITGDKGALVASGLEWREFNYSLLGWLVVLCVVSGLAFFVNPNLDPTFGFLFLVVCVLSAVGALRYAICKRAVIFEITGRISVPHGLPAYPWFRSVHGNHGALNNFAVSSDGASVTGNSFTGKVVLFARGIVDNRGQEVSTRMNIALREIRMAGASFHVDLGGFAKVLEDASGLPSVINDPAQSGRRSRSKLVVLAGWAVVVIAGLLAVKDWVWHFGNYRSYFTRAPFSELLWNGFSTFNMSAIAVCVLTIWALKRYRRG